MRKIKKNSSIDKTYVFIDASNIIYGTRNEGWKVDFKKLFKYLTQRYKSKKIYYFAGQDIKNLDQQKFYKLLSKIGYELVLKPVKIFNQIDGSRVRKANCDVDLTFYAMKDFNQYSHAIFLSGDGDFYILLDHLIKNKKIVTVIANGKRTAKEIKSLVGNRFTDMNLLKKLINFAKKMR